MQKEQIKKKKLTIPCGAVSFSISSINLVYKLSTNWGVNSPVCFKIAINLGLYLPRGTISLKKNAIDSFVL